LKPPIQAGPFSSPITVPSYRFRGIELRTRVELSSARIMHVAHAMLIDEKPMICGMCGRRICDIAIIRGDVHLLRASRRDDGIPQQVPKGRIASGSGSINGSRGRWPNVKIYLDKSHDRYRIVHEHKRNGRGTLDRTIKADTLEKMYTDAVASDQREVVLT
jgi:hypothetical protein